MALPLLLFQSSLNIDVILEIRQPPCDGEVTSTKDCGDVSPASLSCCTDTTQPPFFRIMFCVETSLFI